jgi:hypothetical protein
VKLAALLLCALVVAGCGEQKGRYAKFDDTVTVKSWEVWQDPSARTLYLRSLVPFATHGPGSCAGDSEVFRIVGRTLQSSRAPWASLGNAKVLPARRFASTAALWRYTEARALFARVEVEQALRNGVARAKPDWVKEFERSCPRGAD